jgi:rfaE bifunctional protein kinase chain/domain
MSDVPNEISSLLKAIRGTTVTVFGDFCVDAYWSLDETETELSVETGLPIRRVVAQRYSLGGAGNVVANLADLGVGSVHAVGVAGTDMFGEKMRSLLKQQGAETAGYVADADYQTMVYAKPCFGQREDSRLDFGAFNTIGKAVQDELIKNLDAAAKVSNAVILNQQIPLGVSSPAVIERINNVIAAHPKVMFVVDARHYPEHYKGTAMKLNMSEAARLLGEEKAEAFSEIQAKDFAQRISQKSGKPAFITRGEHGLVVAANGETTVVPGIQVLQQVDPVGAGDAVVSALAAALAAGAPPATAAVLANVAAMITVKKLQTTGTASPAEIMAAAPELNYIFRPELANSPRHARYVAGTEIEIVSEEPTDLAIKHCIFDHDGTLSTLREGWEKIMEPMMLHAILGKQHNSVDEGTFEGIRAEVKQFIDRTTGIQTLVQMVGLVELVKHFGFVPKEEILDEHGYKHIFNVDLLKMVGARVEKLRKGELESTDFQIKNAAKLLDELHRRGVKMYLASGTDEVDAKAEAEAMGYAHYFEGRIFGAVGDVNVEAKKMVLEKIIGENKLQGHEFATFGDGPVELRETKRRGGLCIGVASDELRRFGLNLSKRKRLIRAGADLIIPDFSQLAEVLKVMHLDKSPIVRNA